jgi:ferredoxin
VLVSAEPPASVLRVNPIACTGHGICAELLPELITLDPWGYPIMPTEPVPDELTGLAKKAVADCPALALFVSRRKG